MRWYFAAKYYFPFKWFTITHTMQNHSTYLQETGLKFNAILIWLKSRLCFPSLLRSVPNPYPGWSPQLHSPPGQTGMRFRLAQPGSQRCWAPVIEAPGPGRALSCNLGGWDYSERERHFLLPSSLPELRRRWILDCSQAFCHHTRSEEANRKETEAESWRL